MKRYLGVAMMVFVGTAGWRIGESLSSDALSMAVGVLFGVLAGIPTALLVMSSGRRRETSATESGRQRGDSYAMHGYPMMGGYMPQPPVIVVAGPPAMQSTSAYVGAQGGMGGANRQAMDRPARSFKVVGEREEWIEEW